MTDHIQLQMTHEDRRITEKELIEAILNMNIVCTVAMPDTPYPYIVPMNYGWCWENSLVLYMHMANCGHRLALLEKSPIVSCSISMFLDRFDRTRYRGEGHDYRSVTVYGKAEVITSENPEEFLKGLNLLCKNAGHTQLKKTPGNRNLLVMKVSADIVTAKAQYPISGSDEVVMPPLDWDISEE